MSPTFRPWMAALAVAFLACIAAGQMQPKRTAAAAVPVDPAAMNFLALCDAYRAAPTDQLLAEISRRHEFPPGDYQHVITGQVFVGMSRSGLVCARGWPQQTRSTTSSYGTTDWYSYTSPRMLVRLDDGVVHSFSN